MSFEKVFYSSFVKGIGRTVGVLTIFGSLGLFYISFTNLYNYSQKKINQKDNQLLYNKENEQNVNINVNVNSDSESDSELEENEIENEIENAIENYENSDLFKKLFDKLK
jgi:hypothetical protein